MTRLAPAAARPAAPLALGGLLAAALGAASPSVAQARPRRQVQAAPQVSTTRPQPVAIALGLRLRRPTQLARTPDGEVLVLDEGAGRVHLLSTDLTPRRDWRRRDLGQARELAGVAALERGELVATGASPPALVRTRRGGRGAEVFLIEGRDALGPCAVGRDPQRTWVLVPRRHQLWRLGPRGQVEARLGGFGRAPGRLNEPVDVASGDHDTAWVLERAGRRVQRLDRGGRVLALARGDLVRPQGLDQRPDGWLWVTDPGARALVLFAASGQPVARVELPPAIARPWDVLDLGEEGVLVSDPGARALWRIPPGALPEAARSSAPAGR